MVLDVGHHPSYCTIINIKAFCSLVNIIFATEKFETRNHFAPQLSMIAFRLIMMLTVALI